MFKRFMAVLLMVGACGLSHAGTDPFNAGSTDSTTITNLVTGGTNNVAWQAGGDKFLRFSNTGSNNILWAFGTTITTGLYVVGTTTTSFYNAECLTPGSTTTPFDMYYFPNTNLYISAITTNGTSGRLVKHHGY